MSNILDRMNITQSYQDVYEEEQARHNIVISSPQKARKEKVAEIVEKISSPSYEEPRPVRSQAPPVQYEVIQEISPSKASPPKAELSQENLERKDWSFVADREVLEKEFDLGKGLVSQAITKVTAEVIDSVVA